MGLQPAVVAPGWMRQRQQRGPVLSAENLAPTPDRRREAALRFGSQVPGLRILADQQDELEGRERREDALAPQGSAFASRRQVGALGVLPRKAMAHRHDRDPARVVKARLVEAE